MELTEAQLAEIRHEYTVGFLQGFAAVMITTAVVAGGRHAITLINEKRRLKKIQNSKK